MRKLNKKDYIGKCGKCGTIYLIKEKELLQTTFLNIINLKYYECRKCFNVRIHPYRLDNLVEFTQYPLVKHNTEFDPKDNDHQ